MKLKETVFSLALMALAMVLAFSAPALADEVKVIAVVTKITLADDGKSAIATMKENESGNVIEVLVTDDLTLDKFKDHRIVAGDEIRLKYVEDNGKKISKYFRKTAGC